MWGKGKTLVKNNAEVRLSSTGIQCNAIQFIWIQKQKIHSHPGLYVFKSCLKLLKKMISVKKKNHKVVITNFSKNTRSKREIGYRYTITCPGWRAGFKSKGLNTENLKDHVVEAVSCLSSWAKGCTIRAEQLKSTPSQQRKELFHFIFITAYTWLTSAL